MVSNSSKREKRLFCLVRGVEVKKIQKVYVLEKENNTVLQQKNHFVESNTTVTGSNSQQSVIYRDTLNSE